MAPWFGEVLGDSSVGPVAAWYVTMLLMTAVGLAPAAALFPRLASRGVHLARPLGLALVALLTWLAVHLTPLPYGSPAVLLSLATIGSVGIGVSLWRLRGWAGCWDVLRERWREFAVVEVVGAFTFVAIVLMRMQTPDAWGTEKPADLMMLTAVHRTTELPPLDPWAAGETISYYHLGQLQMDHVARLAGVGPEVAFNLAVAAVGAMALAAVAGLAMDIVRMDSAGPARRVRRSVLWLAGGVAAAGVLLVAPLAGLVQVLAANGLGTEMWARFGVEGIPPEGGATALVPDAFWWWWPTTRVVPGVISEYPAFSILLGDPHPHLLSLPLGVVGLALATQVFSGATPLSWRRWFLHPDELLLTSALFAALAMTNSWDVLSYGAIWAGAAWWAAARAGWPVHTALLVAARWALTPALLGVLLAYPFLASLDPAPLGVAWVRGESSDLPRWLLFWLPVALPAIAGGLFLARMQPVAALSSIVPLLLLCVPVLAWAGAMVAGGEASEIVDRGAGWLTVLLLLAGIAWAGLRARGSAREHRGQEIALGLLGAAGVVLLVTEFVHIDDQFPGRMNTVFKFWFHTWVTLAIGGGALLALSSERWLSGWTAGSGNTPERSTRPGLVPATAVAVAGILWAATMMVPPLMAVSRAGEGQERGLDATTHLDRHLDQYLDQRGDGFATAVAWGLAVLDPSRHVVVEGVGESYGDGNRFSAFTGIPTVLGWPGHQRQWRAEVREGERRSAVAAIYLGSDTARDEGIHEWGVTHVLVGPAERLAFGPTPPIVQSGWRVVFEAGVTQVFEVPEDVRQQATDSTAP